MKKVAEEVRQDEGLLPVPEEDIINMLEIADREKKDPDNPQVTIEDFLAIMSKAGLFSDIDKEISNNF